MSTVERIFSIQSHVVSGYVGNKCAVFALQVLGFDVDAIDSVYFSNHTGYGQWKGQVLQENDLWELYIGLKCNNLANYTKILSGYARCEGFLRQICNIIRDIKANNPGSVYLCDPVLGDHGRFYVPPSLVNIYLDEVLPLADIVTPNTFEMEALSGMKLESEEAVLEATNRLHLRGVSIVVLTSLDTLCPSSNIVTYVSFKPSTEIGRRVWKVNVPRLSANFTGIGDLFSALFLGWYTKLGQDIPLVVTNTLSTIGKVLQRTYSCGLLHRSTSTTPPELQLIQSLDDIRSPQNNLEAIEIPLQSPN